MYLLGIQYLNITYTLEKKRNFSSRPLDFQIRNYKIIEIKAISTETRCRKLLKKADECIKSNTPFNVLIRNKIRKVIILRQLDEECKLDILII